jgi:hypothetical protein
MQQMQQVLAKSISYVILAKSMENKGNFVNSKGNGRILLNHKSNDKKKERANIL